MSKWLVSLKPMLFPCILLVIVGVSLRLPTWPVSFKSMLFPCMLRKQVSKKKTFAEFDFQADLFLQRILILYLPCSVASLAWHWWARTLCESRWSTPNPASSRSTPRPNLPTKTPRLSSTVLGRCLATDNNHKFNS